MRGAQVILVAGHSYLEGLAKEKVPLHTQAVQGQHRFVLGARRAQAPRGLKAGKLKAGLSVSEVR